MTPSRTASTTRTAAVRPGPAGTANAKTADHVDRSGRSRAVIDAVRPVVDGGRFAVKRVVGEPVRVAVDAFTDGHDQLGCVLRYRHLDESTWHELAMRESPNDLWTAEFTPTSVGHWAYHVQAWVDPFRTWAHDLSRRIDAGQDIETDLAIGAAIIRDTAAAIGGGGGDGDREDANDADALQRWANRLTGGGTARERGLAALGDELADLMWRASPRRHAVTSDPLPLWVDRPLALFGAWYEMFPRSAAGEPGRHGTLRDAARHVPYVAEMGFDILYLPPIHPIGRTARKGPNNTTAAGEDDVGSPWAIGGPEGGHMAVHPDLGTIEDFDALIAEARDHGLEVALDIAFQCSPDHPWVTEHPEWFRHRPDGSIQYAENPPKKYQDIYPFDFECTEWEALWHALKRVFLFWAEHGVRVFRVDNPHTKPFVFWDWVIAEVRREHPDAIFLSEAFTRPKRMKRLAKGGFSQSYTYFAWRNGPEDLREYMEELSTPPECDLMRPNFWPNTPDILTEHLATGGRAAGMARLVLAATLTPSYGIYGPVYELADYAQRPGAEENLDSEKYQLKHWDREDRWSLRHFIALVNRIRREHTALQQFRNISFHHCDNPAHVAYSKRSDDGRDVILCIVNSNPHQEHWGVVRLDLSSIGVAADAPFVAHDLLSGSHYQWHGADQVIGLEPGRSHILHIESAGRDEQDFETFA